uniref:Suppressor APC domain-containing protein n=1 Tax=Ciona savignyi TaxID=51511 RepID=H2YCD0_CIOSA
HAAAAPVSGLPKQFVNSMKTLFNILDDNGIGLVPLTEIERRWRDDAVPNLPGVLDCLRSVAPPDGLLSFETFVWGLRTALSRARHDKDSGSEKSFQCVSEKSDLDRITANTLFINSDDKRSMNKMKPIGLSGKYIGITGTLQRAKSSACIPNHYGIINCPCDNASCVSHLLAELKGSGIPAGGYATVGRRRHGGSKKREPRRHTVTNGIDYNVLKLIKQLEQEKDVLLQGLETLNRGRQWFQDRICDVQEKQRLLSNNGLKPTSDVTENDATATQARIDGLLTKVSDMTKFVQSMSDDNTETRVVLLIFLNFITAKRPRIKFPIQQSRVVTALREQNHILTQDVTQKSDKIVQLEHEKSVLVQQLFQAKAEAQCVDGQVNTSIF